MPALPQINLQSSPDWKDYELLDCGDGRKLERFGPYTLIRPEAEAIWRPAQARLWLSADAEFTPSAEKNGGHWVYQKPIPERWQMEYKGLRFWAQTTASKHVGLFPEQASQWDWLESQIQSSKRRPNVLNLFGYTGIASLAAARSGAEVTHVDASQKSINWGKENQALSGLKDSPIRWLVDDAFKFVKREIRRGSQYDGLILDPPKFGRGPKGEVWEFYKILPDLLDGCRQILSPQPIFLLLTAYAVKASSLTLHFALDEMMRKYKGNISVGEVLLQEKTNQHAISMAIFARWSK
jgi:23S rRNA (cytosine1962-C5)-methyltransferase